MKKTKEEKQKKREEKKKLKPPTCNHCEGTRFKTVRKVDGIKHRVACRKCNTEFDSNKLKAGSTENKGEEHAVVNG